jgi:hypothetical protein
MGARTALKRLACRTLRHRLCYDNVGSRRRSISLRWFFLRFASLVLFCQSSPFFHLRLHLLNFQRSSCVRALNLLERLRQLGCRLRFSNQLGFQSVQCRLVFVLFARHLFLFSCMTRSLFSELSFS